MSTTVYLIALTGRNRESEVGTVTPWIYTREAAPVKLQGWGRADTVHRPEPAFIHRRFERIPDTLCYLEVP